jgi:energy-coupling factor transporter ATP-binding protein EcfA2
MLTSTIKVENLTVRYPLAEKPALNRVSFDIQRSEMIGVIGPCLSGKTTLCLCLKGLIPHMVTALMEGTVQIEGVDTRHSNVPELAKKVGMVLDDPEAQLTQLTAKEEIAFGLQNLGVPREEIERRVAEMIDLVGLKGLEDRAPIDLSGGQQQRLSIGSVLAMYPEILVLDEPTSNLDPIGKEEVFRVLWNLKVEKRMTIVVAENDVERLAAFADRIMFLSEGEIAMIGSPSRVFNEVEVLKAKGENGPQVTMLCSLIKRGRSWPWPTLPVNVEEAYERVAQVYGIR